MRTSVVHAMCSLPCQRCPRIRAAAAKLQRLSDAGGSPSCGVLSRSSTPAAPPATDQPVMSWNLLLRFPACTVSSVSLNMSVYTQQRWLCRQADTHPASIGGKIAKDYAVHEHAHLVRSRRMASRMERSSMLPTAPDAAARIPACEPATTCDSCCKYRQSLRHAIDKPASGLHNGGQCQPLYIAVDGHRLCQCIPPAALSMRGGQVRDRHHRRWTASRSSDA